jgi:Hemerythrin HHE cation binding domain
MRLMAKQAQSLKDTLEEQHRRIKGQLRHVEDSHGEARVEAFLALRRFLAAHETIEQAVMHPTVREGRDTANVAEQRVAEEGKATSAIEVLEQFDVDSPQFSDQFASLAENVVAHAEAEEHVELPAYLADASDDDVAEVVAALRQVDAVAARVATGGIAGNPGFAAMLERAKSELASLSR